MSKHRFEIEVEIDDTALKAHVEGDKEKGHGSDYPITADPSEFYWRDLDQAIFKGIADEPEITDYEEIKGE